MISEFADTIVATGISNVLYEIISIIGVDINRCWSLKEAQGAS